MRSSILITVIASLLPLTGWAEVFPDSLAAPIEMEQVVVTGTRTPKLLANTPVLTKVISADDIRRPMPQTYMTYYNKSFHGVEFSSHEPTGAHEPIWLCRTERSYPR